MNRQRHMIVWLTCLSMISCGRGSGEGQPEMRLEQYASHLALRGEQGRVSCTLEEAEAVNYITDQFRMMGLSRFGDEGTYLRQVVLRGAEAEEMGVDNHRSRNVAGVITGSVYPERFVIVGARYDGPDRKSVV